MDRNNFDCYEVIVTSTSARTPIINEGNVDNSVIVAIGSYINSISELDKGIVCSSRSLLADSKEQSTDKSVEVYNAINSGCLNYDDIHTISELFRQGTMKFRREHGPIILKSMGMAAEDLATAIAIYQKYNRRM